MAFKATRNMPFSLVLQKLSSFRVSSEIFNIVLFMVSCILITGYSIPLFMNPLNFIGHFVAVILKVLLVNLLAALRFANVFLNKNVSKIKSTLKNVKNVTKIKKA